MTIIIMWSPVLIFIKLSRYFGQIQCLVEESSLSSSTENHPGQLSQDIIPQFVSFGIQEVCVQKTFSSTDVQTLHPKGTLLRPSFGNGVMDPYTKQASK